MKSLEQLTVLTVIGLTACIGPAANGADFNRISPGWHDNLTLQHEGMTRLYRVYVPKRVQTRSPAVVLLHGGAQNMDKIFRPRAGGTRAWLDIADRDGVVLVVPNGTNIRTGDADGDRQSWNDSRGLSPVNDVGFILSLLNRVENRYPIDPKRVYVTGASNGGMMTYRLLIEAPQRFAAGAAFIAGLPDVTLPQPTQPKPLMIVNGTADPLMPWQGGPIAGRRGAVRSTRETVSWWVRANNASPARPSVLLPDLNSEDGCRIKRTYYPAGFKGAPVAFYTMQAGGHAMPSRAYRIRDTFRVRRLIGTPCQDVEGAELAWRFFRRH